VATLGTVVTTQSPLVVRYPDGRAVTLTGEPFSVGAGERVALLGANGSGKSTLLRAVLGLARPASGAVRVFGRDPAREFDTIRPRIGAVLQDVEAQLLAPTVREDLAFGLGSTVPREEAARRVEAAARAFDLLPLLDKVPHYLSGGERGGVALPGALVTEPDLLVLDEPFAGLDPTSRSELAALIRREHAHRGMAVLLTTHEVHELPSLVDTVYLLSADGVLRVRGAPEAIFAMPDLLAACNVEAPPLARLLDTLRAGGLDMELPDGADATDPLVVAEAVLRHLRAPRRPAE
jgi:cobalt/nickel transport system ATP-binding protein